jgi:hypothetical protein
MEVMKPTAVRKNIYNVLKLVAKNHSELEIPVDDEDSVVVMSKKTISHSKNYCICRRQDS